MYVCTVLYTLVACVTQRGLSHSLSRVYGKDRLLLAPGSNVVCGRPDDGGPSAADDVGGRADQWQTGLARHAEESMKRCFDS